MTEIVSEIKLTSLVGFICASQPLGFVRGALIGGPNLDGRVAAAALVARSLKVIPLHLSSPLLNSMISI